MVVGGDGFCGWPIALNLVRQGYEVLILDNLSRRSIDVELGTRSLADIAPIEHRVCDANEVLGGSLSFKVLDVARQPLELLKILREFAPIALVHLGEQRAAPYSMISSETRRYTIDNNVVGTHNICDAIAESGLQIHLIHLGTMGVYGYDESFGTIPEGYVKVARPDVPGSERSIVYPYSPGSIYHLTKCLDHEVFQFYSKNWGLCITDLHQGIVWGFATDETLLAPKLANRVDYDGVYGTVLNRFITQAIHGHPLTVYGTGGQTRAFIHISDTCKCVGLALANPPLAEQGVRVLNQVAETHTVLDLARLISEKYDVPVEYIENPRREKVSNSLTVDNSGFKSLGFKPKLLADNLIDDVASYISALPNKIDREKILTSPKW